MGALSGAPNAEIGSLTGRIILLSMIIACTRWIMSVLGWAASSRKLVSLSPNETLCSN